MGMAFFLDESRLEGLRMLVESAAGIASRHGDLKAIRKLRFQRPGVDRQRWNQFAAMGWLGMCLPEEAGGAGLGMAEYAALATEIGGALLPEPLIEAQLALALMGHECPQGALDGTQLILPAWMTGPGGLGPEASLSVSGDRISGTRTFIPMGEAADAFLVVAPDACFLVDAKAPGISITSVATLDGGHSSTLRLQDVEARAYPAPDARAFEAATLATVASLLGVMERAFAMTLDYLKARVQFGQSIGNFQVLQHRAVDLEIEIRLTRAALRDAAAAMDAGEDCRRIVSRAKARASDAAMLVTRQAIQLHGAIGYTEEADIGLFLRRAMVLAPRYGDADFHRSRYGTLQDARP